MVAGRDYGIGRDVLSHDDVLDKVIVWRMNDPRYTDRDNKLRSLPMAQRQWTIEARADFEDAEKNEVITEAVRQAAVHIHATLALLSDKQKPQVVCFSDDFFTGHEDIALIKDKMGDALAEHGDDMQIKDGEVSEEMMGAMRDMQHDKNNG